MDLKDTLAQVQTDIEETKERLKDLITCLDGMVRTLNNLDRQVAETIKEWEKEYG